MTWMKTLAQTFDVFADLAGVEKNNQPILLPVSHSTFQAQIEVTLDQNGTFYDAKKLEKGSDTDTIIPVTEDSAARSSGIAPHPLCDKLCYVAGDYASYTGEAKEAYYEAYIARLEKWVKSNDTHPMVQAVYRYLVRKTLIRDLAKKGVLELDNGRLTDQHKIQGFGQTGANVRFRVLGCMPQEVWKNRKLYQTYISYCRHNAGETKLCYVSGQLEACSDKHPSKIRNSGDKAKLISGNDETGFTYRGRFAKKEQAVTVGYDTSQKAHNALRWLIEKQGYTRDESAIVCWMANRDMPVPDPMKDSVNAYRNVIDESAFDFDEADIQEDSDVKPDTGKHFAVQFRNAVNGYVGKIKTDDKIAIIALEAATTGRLSVVYYDEMGGRQYMDAVLNWQRHCSWRRSIKTGKTKDEQKWVTCECTPSPRDMALAAFGVQQSEWLKADEKRIRSAVKRLLYCITRKGIPIPADFIKAALQRASMPQTMSGFIWYNDVLCVVCAMIRYNYELGGKAMKHFLIDNGTDRNVLFGRLLAVFDYMEQRAMFEYGDGKKGMDQRMTNAKRYWNAYSSRPARTSKTIRQNLIAYERRLKPYELRKFEEWMEEIMTPLAGNGFDNTALSEQYLPGYYLQMEAMKKAFQKKEEPQKEDQQHEA